jgi:hypothetical protein
VVTDHRDAIAPPAPRDMPDFDAITDEAQRERAETGTRALPAEDGAGTVQDAAIRSAG